MRALWSDRPNCSHNVSQKVKRIRCFSEFLLLFRREILRVIWRGFCVFCLRGTSFSSISVSTVGVAGAKISV